MTTLGDSPDSHDWNVPCVDIEARERRETLLSVELVRAPGCVRQANTKSSKVKDLIAKEEKSDRIN